MAPGLTCLPRSTTHRKMIMRHRLTIDIQPYFSGPEIATGRCSCGRWARTLKGGLDIVTALTKAHRDHVTAKEDHEQS